MIYLLVLAIINITAAIEMKMPTMIFVVNASPKTNVPMRIAVIGSNTPRTDALVAPIFRVATANVEVETMVGRIANPMRFNHAILFSRPVVISASDVKSFMKNTMAPTPKA